MLNWSLLSTPVVIKAHLLSF